jgi:membrane-bound lytic murein transglycosylase MltF
VLASLWLGACSGDGDEPRDTRNAGDAETPAIQVEVPKRRDTSLGTAYDHITTWTGDLDGMAERRVIRILTVYSIGRYYLDGAHERGMVRETATRFEDFINRRLGRRTTRVHVAVVPVARDQLIPTLLQGRGDIIVASLSVTPERENVLDFSAPSSKPLSEILVTGPSAPAVVAIEDLAGQTVYLRESSSYRESVETLNERFRNAGLEPVDIEPVSELLEDADIVEMVNAGMLPWAIVDDYKLRWWDGVFDELTARPDIVFRDGGRLAWAMRQNSPQLKAAINDFLATHREGTLIGNVLQNRYVRDFDWAANALSKEAYSRFAELEDIFRKYGERYKFEYLSLAAQGYQESRLDQSARSAAGAIGVMQVKPSTARDPNVGIHDIHEVDPNIHAGTRYMHFLRDRYFSHKGIDEINSWLMSLAAYNMGPRRMIKLREQAKKLGYDANQWFDNVEIAAAKHVGREPVQYVANVYKYYLAYLLSAEQLRQRSQARLRAGMDPLAPVEG